MISRHASDFMIKYEETRRLSSSLVMRQIDFQVDTLQSLSGQEGSAFSTSAISEQSASIFGNDVDTKCWRLFNRECMPFTQEVDRLGFFVGGGLARAGFASVLYGAGFAFAIVLGLVSGEIVRSIACLISQFAVFSSQNWNVYALNICSRISKGNQRLNCVFRLRSCFKSVKHATIDFVFAVIVFSRRKLFPRCKKVEGCSHISCSCFRLALISFWFVKRKQKPASGSKKSYREAPHGAKIWTENTKHCFTVQL
mmetsp:Transcript_91456/g.179129  ORF Transcript_91456/g.179129 Transcript_91456/m.179129 type:complete len:254 (-) Transcript_91456:463-1224(-)